jgi:pimeloyl-ACP methyl ester carboxylesterase
MEDSGTRKPCIVLVHGAFVDATSWQHVIRLLQEAGYPVVAVQNPLTSLADDIATTKRVIESETRNGPIILVGHSYGGVVISGAATGSPNVKALVYLTAFAPDAGEPIGSFFEQYPSALLTAIVPDAAGFLIIDRAQFHAIYGHDVDAAEARVLAATQKPITGAVLHQALEDAAWKTIPSWYLISTQDQSSTPALQRFFAERMGATIREIAASHAAYISHPQAVVTLIEEAAQAIHAQG